MTGYVSQYSYATPTCTINRRAKIKVIIREATLSDVPAIARIHMDSWRTAYRGLVSDYYLDNLRLEDRVARWQQRLTDPQVREFAYVAQDPSGTVVGFGSGIPDTTDRPDYKSELRALHISPSHQRAGLGRRLT